MFIADKFQFVEIPVETGAANTITIQDQPSLRGKFIQGLVIYIDDFLAFSPQNKKPTISISDAANMVLELFVQDNRVANRIPLSELVKTQTTTGFSNYAVFRCNNWQLTWDTCNLIILNAVTANRTVTLGVYYSDNPQQNNF